MKLRQPILPWCSLVVLAASVGVVAGAGGGEPIRFSKPAVPIAVQAKEEEGLPAQRDKKPDFSGASLQQPAIAQPNIVRVQPREKENDEDAGKHWLIRDPKNFPDATGRANAREALANRHNSSRRDSGGDDSGRDSDSNRRDSSAQDKNQSGSPWSRDGSALKRPEGASALSPITDFHWDARSESQSNSWAGARLGSSDKKDSLNPFGRNFGRDESSEPNAGAGSSFFSDLFVPRAKEKSTEAQLEHRAAFERLLNQNTTVSTRTGGSLEPVAAVETSKGVVPGVMPSIISPKVESSPLQSMEGFNQRQLQLRAPVAGDFNNKFNDSPAPAVPASAGAVTDPRFQTPLMRQPTIREIPARKF